MAYVVVLFSFFNLDAQNQEGNDSCLKHILYQLSLYILNKSENATPELFATYIQNYANQECN